MPGTSSRIFGRFLIALGALDHQGAEDLALGVQRPDVGAVVVLLLREAPVLHSAAGGVAAHAEGLVQGVALTLRVAHRRDGVVGVLHRIDVRPNDAVNADIEHLLGDPVRLTGIRRDADDRRHGRRHGTSLGDEPRVEQIEKPLLQGLDVVDTVLHLEDAAIEGRTAGGAGIAGDERYLPLLQGLDDAVKSR